MTRSIQGQLIDSAGSVAWLYMHNKPVKDVKKAIKHLRKIITELENTLEKEGIS